MRTVVQEYVVAGYTPETFGAAEQSSFTQALSTSTGIPESKISLALSTPAAAAASADEEAKGPPQQSVARRLLFSSLEGWMFGRSGDAEPPVDPGSRGLSES